MRFTESPGINSAIKEIFLSLRKGFDVEWAKNRFIEKGGEEKVFHSAFKKFRMNDELYKLAPFEWEVPLSSKKFRLSGVVDELSIIDSEIVPLAISSSSPKEGVWFKDLIKISCYSLLLSENKEKFENFRFKNRGFVYYAINGRLVGVSIGRLERINVIRIIERVTRLRKGFVPERKESGRCRICSFRESCDSVKSTFASRFL
jgi:CRISPR-associated exonuclease Cas4